MARSKNATLSVRLNRDSAEQVTGIVFVVKDVGESELKLAQVSEANKVRAVVHGFTQRCSDRAAISRDTKTGKPASAKDKFDAIDELVQHYNSGAEVWSTAREGGGGPSAETGLLITALCEHYPKKTRDELTLWVRKRSATERMALCEEPNIKAIIERLRAETAKDIKVDDLLSELNDVAEEASGGGTTGEEEPKAE